MAQRRKRRTKAEIDPDKAAKAAKAAEEAEMKEKGFEKVRLRDDHGHFIKDDPSTPENEAWEWRKIEEEVKTDEVITEMFEESVVEATFGSAYEKEIDALSEDPAKEEPAKNAHPVIANEDDPRKMPYDERANSDFFLKRQYNHSRPQFKKLKKRGLI